MQTSTDIITLNGLSSVDATTEVLVKTITGRGIFIYAIIDQASEARKAGMDIKPLTLLIFGNPKGGIPLMNANPLSGLDLPLKLLIWQDDQNKIWVSYNSFSYLQKRFDLPEALIANLSGVEKLIHQALNL